MDFGITFFPTVGPAVKAATAYYDESFELAELADEVGLDHVKIVEHYFFDYGGYSPDPVTFLAAVAARTRHVRLGTSAVIPAFTHPIKLAGKLAMLDNISHGRLDAAFGRAFLPDEFAAFGVPLDESRARFTEGIEAIKLLWTTGEAVWDGQFHQFGPVTLQPRPVQAPHPPVYVTSARSPESCVEAGRRGHRLQVVPGVLGTEQLQERMATYRQAWRESGHPEDGAKVHLSYPCVIDEDGDQARKMARFDDERNGAAIGAAVQSWAQVNSADYPGYDKLADTSKRMGYDEKHAENRVLAGTPDEVLGQLETIVDWFGDNIGISLGIHSGHLPAEAAARTIRLMAEKVAPRFAS